MSLSFPHQVLQTDGSLKELVLIEAKYVTNFFISFASFTFSSVCDTNIINLSC